MTRLADITGLDRIGIPVHSAIVPRSLDPISVYNGKGPTALDSRVGALMEVVERLTALHAQPELFEGRYEDLKCHNTFVADPRSFIHALSERHDPGLPILWMRGYDLLQREPVLVPAGLAGYGPQYLRNNSPYEVNGSTGLASGNCFEEAVCHGLCELIERDAWTFADLKSRWIPFARHSQLFGNELAALVPDDPNAHPRIDLTGAGEPISNLLAQYENAGMHPIVRDITSGLGIQSVIATVADDCVPGFPQAHGGLGAHPNARIAVARALTEVAQSRAVDIQGVREDLHPAGVEVHPSNRHLRRVRHVEYERWLFQHAGVTRPLSALPSALNEDIAEDIALVLSRLAANGIDRVIVVDFSEPGSPFSVVRVIVPGLEFWSSEYGRVGPRATRFWRENF